MTILDDSGKRLGSYFNDGWIEQLHWLAPDRLLFGGFSESKNGGMVGLLDPNDLDGQSPEDVASSHWCESCGARPPLVMAVMPRSEVNLAAHARFNRAIVEKTRDRLIVRSVEVPASPDNQGVADAVYEFTRDLQLVSASYSERYWEFHDRLAAEKKIDHDRASCPHRNGPPLIHLWKPQAGWQALTR